jgi:hypothetical protein
MNICQQITGAALSAYLPTFTKENGFKGANAQIATLAPYGSAAVVSPFLIAHGHWLIDNRAWSSFPGSRTRRRTVVGLHRSGGG